MYDFVIIHGSFGNQYENWFPWIFEKLSGKEKSVLVPQFPSPSGQNFDQWSKVLDAYDDLIGPSTIIIGHSLAPAFIADYLVSKAKSIKGFIGVAPFYGLINIEEFDAINSDFFKDDVDVSKVREYASFRHFIYSDNDPYVPKALSDAFSEACDATVTIIPSGGHINAGAGFTEFQQLLEIIDEYRESS